MKHSMVQVLLACVSVAACGGTTSSDSNGQPLDVSNEVAVDSKPRSVPQAVRLQPRTARTMLTRSSSLVEGTVTDIGNVYDERSGPRTIYTFDVTRVLAGSAEPGVTELNVFGGQTPDGKGASTSATVRLKQGARYLLLLSNEAWFYSPWIGDPLRIEQGADQTVLVGPHEQIVVGLVPEGIRYGGVFGAAPAAKALPGDSAPLSRDEYIELLNEAMEVEAIRPTGSFFAAPMDRGADWRQRPVAPPQ